MRRAAACLAVLAALGAAAPAARAAERIDAQMLLDLDLLREDPAPYRDAGAAERMRLLELLRMLDTPAAVTPAGESAPGTAPATPPPPQRGVK